jgi:chorismate synthase
LAGNTLGNIFRVTTWGESHGHALGCVVDGCPAGLELLPEHIQRELARDVPYHLLTKRIEPNDFQILSGVFEDRTIGTPISIVIKNSKHESDKYRKIMFTPRPGHADLSYRLKYGYVDWRGGSRASGRTWIAAIAAGGVARRLCEVARVDVSSVITELGGEPVDERTINERVKQLAAQAEKEKDATGGMIAVTVQNLPSGLGAPAFNRYHADVAHAILSIPGVKSFEIGAGLKAASMKSTQFNDPIVFKDGRASIQTNNAGGVVGGITVGAPVVFRFAVKPTPSIPIPQPSIDLRTRSPATVSTEGNHDANFTPRVMVIAEALTAMVTVDHMMLSGYLPHDSLVPLQNRLQTFGRS